MEYMQHVITRPWSDTMLVCISTQVLKYLHKQNLHIYSIFHACLWTMVNTKELPQPSEFTFQRTLVYCL